MADKSAIEWTDASWTPIRARNLKTGKVGWHCEHATTGCEFCYAEGMNRRLGTGLLFKPGHRKDIEIFLDEEMLSAPLRWKKPRMIFVCSMTDLFADFVKDEWIEKILDVMLQTDHRYQVLTKRAARMQHWITQFLAPALLPTILENIWLGVSIERQEEADERVPLLLNTPAGVRFVSAEPLLGPIDLTRIELPTHALCDALSSRRDGAYVASPATLDWVIVGGESGKSARRMDARWARDVRDQCADADVPFFFKQWGEHDPETFDRVGKKSAGRLLDGREHSAFPVIDRSVTQSGAAVVEATKSFDTVEAGGCAPPIQASRQ